MPRTNVNGPLPPAPASLRGAQRGSCELNRPPLVGPVMYDRNSSKLVDNGHGNLAFGNDEFNTTSRIKEVLPDLQRRTNPRSCTTISRPEHEDLVFMGWSMVRRTLRQEMGPIDYDILPHDSPLIAIVGERGVQQVRCLWVHISNPSVLRRFGGQHFNVSYNIAVNIHDVGPKTPFHEPISVVIRHRTRFRRKYVLAQMWAHVCRANSRTT